ncbi:MAG: hypothetical protein PVSMB1_13220 [Gemmatimonadaceae bacterium]
MSLIDRAIPEIGEANSAVLGISVLEGETRAERNLGADDAVSTEEVGLGIEDVHGATLAPGASGVAAEQLGHDRTGADSARERLAVVPISRDHVIVWADHRHNAGRDRFLPDVEVTEPADLSKRVRLGATLLEATL